MPVTVTDNQKTAGERMRESFPEVRGVSMRITHSLTPEDQMLQSMPDASPTKWHLAHTTWFFETFVLNSYASGYQPFDPRFTYLFNSYYKQLGGHPFRGNRGLMSRPTLEQVHDYRTHVDRAMMKFLETAPPEALGLIELGLNHEQQHQELILTDIKHGLWSAPLSPEPTQENSVQTSAPALSWIAVEDGIHSIGHNGQWFAFDNEGPRHDVLLRPCEVASRPVANQEYMEFMNDNGYGRPELWLSEGWDTVCREHWNAPFYWERHEDGSWWQFAHHMLKLVNPAEPVCHISYFEADAFARWSGKRLPTEEEWEIAAEARPVKGTLLDDSLFHPQPAKGEGMQQIFGDVWEWTASPYVAYPGFKPAAGAVGEYNGKFMCNQFVLRGGSCVTPASHIRTTYRNFFPPQARWQFSGLRLANDRS
jgi:ergothioneine biosynthesis protein EgtB